MHAFFVLFSMMFEGGRKRPAKTSATVCDPAGGVVAGSVPVPAPALRLRSALLSDAHATSLHRFSLLVTLMKMALLHLLRSVQKQPSSISH